MTDIMNATAFPAIFIFLTWQRKKIFLLTDVNPYARALMYLFLQQPGIRLAGGQVGEAGPSSPGLSPMNGATGLNLTGVPREFK